MTHPPSPTGGTPSMASLLARVQPEPTPEPKADGKATPKTVAAVAEARPGAADPGTPSPIPAGSGVTSPAAGTAKGVPVKRLLVWAVPLVFLAVGAALMNQSPTAGMLFLLLAVVALIVVLIAKWLGKRRAGRAAHPASGPHTKGPGRGLDAGRGRGPGDGGKGGVRGALGALWPFGKRNRKSGPGGGLGGPGATPPAGGKPPAGGLSASGGKGGRFARFNPFSRTKSGVPGGKPTAAGSPGGGPAGVGATAPAGGRAGSSPAAAPSSPKGLGGKLRGLLGGKPAGALGQPGGPGGRGPAGGHAPASGRASAPTAGRPGRPSGGGLGGSGARGGATGGLLGGLFGGKRSGPAVPAGSSHGDGAGAGGGGRGLFGWRPRAPWTRGNRSKAADNPRNWRNSSQRYEQRYQPFRRGSDVPRDLASGTPTPTSTPSPDPASSSSGGRRNTRHDGEYRGGGQREQFATPHSGGGASRNPDGSYNAEPVDDNEAPTGARWADAERMDQPPPGTSDPRPLAPAPAGLGPATSTNTNTSGGNSMPHNDQQTGSRSATILEEGATTARAGAARKDNVAATHRRQAAAVDGIPEMADDAARLRAQAARASADADARRGIGAAFSQAAANHRGA